MPRSGICNGHQQRQGKLACLKAGAGTVYGDHGLTRFKRGKIDGQQRPLRLRHGETPITGPARIRHHPVRTGVQCLKRQRQFRLAHHGADPLAALPAGRDHAEGNRPAAAFLNRAAKRLIAALGKSDLGRAPFTALQPGIDHRQPGLFDKAAKSGGEVRLAGLLGNHLKELRAVGNGILKPFDVTAQCGAERLRAEIGIDHRNDGKTLVIGDGVIGVADVLIHRDRLTHRPCTGKTIQRHGADTVGHRIKLISALGLHISQDDPGGPACETLFQPEVVPPGRCDEVAEPHMCKLVAVNIEKGPARRGAAIGPIENTALTIGDGSGQLRCTARPLWRRDDIKLLIGVRHAKLAFEKAHHWLCHHEGVGNLAPLALPRIAGQRHRRGTHLIRRQRRPFDFIEWSDAKRQEIGRQWPCGLEDDTGKPLFLKRFDALDRRVRNGHGVFWNGQRYIERRLEARFVKAWHEPARLDAFGLRQRIGVALLLHLEQTGEIRVEGGGIAD